MVDVDKLLNYFRLEVEKSKPELSDFRPGSVLYTLARATALIGEEVYQELNTLKASSLILGDEVNEDVIVSLNSSLTRRAGAVSSGNVLIVNSSNYEVLIEPRAVLTDVVTQAQFIIVSSTPQLITSLAEVSLRLEAAELGDHNLKAGTNLISVKYPTLIFKVGAYRDVDNLPKGDLKGGVSPETKTEYLERVRQTLFHTNLNQRQALTDYILEAYSDILDVEVVATAPIITVWISSNRTYLVSELNTLNSAIVDYLPIGVYSEVKQLTMINVAVELASFNNLNFVTTKLVTELVEEFIIKLRSGSTLTSDDIQNLVSARIGVVMKVITPNSPRTLGAGERFSPKCTVTLVNS